MAAPAQGSGGQTIQSATDLVAAGLIASGIAFAARADQLVLEQAERQGQQPAG